MRQQVDGQGVAGPEQENAENLASIQEDGDPGGESSDNHKSVDDEDWSDSGSYNFVVSVSDESDIDPDIFYKAIDENHINKFEDDFFAALSGKNFQPKRKNRNMLKIVLDFYVFNKISKFKIFHFYFYYVFAASVSSL